ncbi:MAG: hypothetical protein KAI41_08800 [Hyphomicrobiaceae bacterium]|nr:hypothetical protein [Hyphomicrobiaceae bacterium]MCK5550616.1 hypothetical protein [Hyphomicrobiaceae bacterium]
MTMHKVGTAPGVWNVDGSTANEQKTHEWFAEASELRFPPGFWPRRISTPLGNGQPFILRRVDDDGTHHYAQIFGCITLTVWND